MHGAMAATSVQRYVRMRNRRREWWDCDVTSFTEADFFQNFGMSRHTFDCVCQHRSARLLRQRWMKCDLTVHTETAMENIIYISDLGAHMKVTQVCCAKK